MTRLIRGKEGQLSIFFSMTLIIVMTVLAFVANIGMFVKAKINLQNAVDAAAWSGAAVQARQLSTIAYLNWEMRNTFKEWMFKYYVLGQLGNQNTDVTGTAASLVGQKMDFRLRRLDLGDGGEEIDRWNIPSICIKLAGTRANICGIFSQPGLPRHGSQGAVSLDAAYNKAVNEFVKAKANNCVELSKFNQQVALLWAYGTGEDGLDFFDAAPQIAAQRPGAWSEALELALRVRNMERIVNVPPASQPLCKNGEGCLNVDSLEQFGDIPLNERSVKAFYAAYRNLGNTDERGPNDLKETFQLTELPPRRGVAIPEESLNNLFIPQPYPKNYLDLQVHTVNFATFFNTFVVRTRGDTSVPGQADCAVAKTALPVPGYPLGFTKNPNTLTYYAVKGEAQFEGLFNPFQESIRLVAYGAAKPYGGRIGPHLFRLNNSQQGVIPRRSRSFPYITAVRKPNGNGRYQLGDPMPSLPEFYVLEDTHTLGGLPDTAASPVRFAIPNLIFDIPPGLNNLTTQDNSGEAIHYIDPNNAPTGAPGLATNTPDNQRGGLYEASQFKLLKDNLELSGSGAVNPQAIAEALDRVRRPTRYDLLNYLIPTIDRGDRELNNSAVRPESMNPVARTVRGGSTGYQLFAPLFGPGLLYQSPADVEGVLLDHIRRSRLAVDNYSQALHEVAQFAREEDGRSAQRLYEQAANAIHDNPTTPTEPSCASLAGQFRFFFSGEGGGDGCRETLREVIIKALQARLNRLPDFAQYIEPTYMEEEISYANNELKSGYTPGPRHGALRNGQGLVQSPLLGGGAEDAHRNFYSTKFVAVESLQENARRSYFSGAFSVYSEGTFTIPSDLNSDLKYQQFANPLSPADLADLDPEGRGLTH